MRKFKQDFIEDNCGLAIKHSYMFVLVHKFTSAWLS